MALQVLEMVLPIVVVLALGALCRAKKFFDQKGLAGLKAVVSNVCLPVVLFNAFFTAQSGSTVCVQEVNLQL